MRGDNRRVTSQTIERSMELGLAWKFLSDSNQAGLCDSVNKILKKLIS